jgi:hypothetical protein
LGKIPNFFPKEIAENNKRNKYLVCDWFKNLENHIIWRLIYQLSNMTSNKPHNFYRLSIVLCATCRERCKGIWFDDESGVIETIPCQEYMGLKMASIVNIFVH